MTRRYTVMIEGDENGYSAYVPELPAILVTGTSIDQITTRSAEAIRLYWESVTAERSPSAMAREIEVEVPV